MDEIQTVVIVLWVLSGYIGAVGLVAKGYMGELVGCTFIAGGLPILLPAVVGPMFLVAAVLLPNKHRPKELIGGDDIDIYIGDISSPNGEINIGKFSFEKPKILRRILGDGQDDMLSDDQDDLWDYEDDLYSDQDDTFDF